ncbi:hypothetical protein [Fredinandcohnia sp. 179-A 10B2 NHS]|uniref:hypothetical protein n=1 Tax=Fredinandcohnia sp. 179-A 10B2 NHS TaxID=3235176 RepID=UPI0039A227D1
MEYQIMFYGGLAGAIITLIISIIVFMKLKISQVLTDITGYRSRKKASAVTGQSRRTDTETKKTTSEIKLRKKDVPAAVEDTAIMSQELEPTAILPNDQKYMAPTELLVEKETAAYMEEETSILGTDDEETMLLSDDDDETTLLQDEDETTILTEGDGETALLNVTKEKSNFEIEVDVMIIHTNQVIEKRGAFSQ